jgi:protein-S-isoprenylcysteine O-methyltransferase Ste14
MTAIASEIIITCWCIFFVVWVVNAARTKITMERQSLASALAHRLPLGLGWWLLIIPKWSRFLNQQILPRTALSETAGAAVCICGLAFTLWARQTLAGNWSSDVTFKQDHELIRRGPYRFVRHPIYTGLLVMFLGTAIFIGEVRGVFSLLLIALGFWIKLRQEERLLLRHFPDAYPIYRAEVKALIPFVI